MKTAVTDIKDYEKYTLRALKIVRKAARNKRKNIWDRLLLKYLNEVIARKSRRNY